MSRGTTDDESEEYLQSHSQLHSFNGYSDISCGNLFLLMRSEYDLKSSYYILSAYSVKFSFSIA